MKDRLIRLIRKAHILYLSVRDNRTPIYAKGFGVFALMWVFFPGDFDFVPVLGWLDDLTMLTLATGLVSTVAPDEVIAEKKQESPQKLRQFVYKSIAVVAVATLLLAILIWRMI